MKKSLMMLITDPINKKEQWYSFSCEIMKTNKGEFIFRNTVLVEGLPIYDKLFSGKSKIIPNPDLCDWEKGGAIAPDRWTKPKKLKKKYKNNIIS